MKYEYDGTGALVNASYFDGTKYVSLESTVYDSYGRKTNLIAHRTSGDYTLKTVYDNLGRPKSDEIVNSNGETENKASYTYAYEYDGNNRLVTKITTVSGIGDESITNVKKYDYLNNLISDKTGNLQISYTYDLAGNVISQTDANGNVTIP